MKKEVNVGVIGLGRIGKLHLHNIIAQIPGIKLIGVSDIIENSLQEVSQKYDIPIIKNDYRYLLDNKEIDAVVICSSTDTHAKIMIEAAQAGKDIFCEKPIALDLKEINRALEAVKTEGIKLQIGFNRRFDPSFMKAKEMVQSGKIGKPHIVKITSRDPAPPPIEYIKVSGGIFLDMTVHDFDMIRYLLDDEVKELMAVGSCLVNPEISKYNDIDTAIITFQYKNGGWGIIDNSRQAVYGYDQRIEVFGSEGCVQVANQKPTEVSLYGAESTTSDKPLYFFLERYNESYINEMKHFVDCIQNDRNPSVSGYDGKMAAIMGYAAKESFSKKEFVGIKNN
ncbi:MAG TPA: inositol 2-dehydrogenase [Candidatus Atribacteria bacterium]|jgi:myo-inositol 2-dehydrogenase/D-chiro-inositol 1-dehydrogenase|nr:inositol 2-dehydrogenase [Candidatus Atribacteria bacterium]